MTRREVFEAALAAVGDDEYELGRRLGYGVNTASRQFARFRRGEGMNFETTIRLLEIAGKLPEQRQAVAT